MITLEEIWARMLMKKEEEKKLRLEALQRKIERTKEKQVNNEATIKMDPEVYFSVENMADNQIGRIKPIKITEYTVPEFVIPTSTAPGFKGSQRNQFSKILAFIKLNQKRRYSKYCTVLSIPTTSKENLSIWNNHTSVANNIDLMCKIGLLEVENPEARKSRFESYSKTYRYYVENEIKFLQYCLENNIEKFDIIKKEDEELEDEIDYIINEETGEVIEINPDDITIEDVEKIKKVVGDGELPEPSHVRFSNDLYLVKPKGFTNKEFEKYLRICLYQNYPYFIDLLKIIRTLNKRFYEDKYPEFQIRFKVSFEWGRKGKKVDERNVVKGISIRETNSYTNKEKNERKKILKDYGFNYEYDVKSSVPRLTYALNTGKWLDTNVDFYELIHNEIDPSIPFTKERREAIKQLHMRAYFDESSYGDLGKHVCRKMNMYGVKRKDVYDEMWKLRQAVVKVEGGKTYGNEIFYVESWVYIKVLNEILTKENQLVWMVYDCFYGKELGSNKVINIVIKNMIPLFIDQYIREWKKINGVKVEITERDLKVYKLLKETAEALGLD